MNFTGNQLKAARVLLGLDQEPFAAALGVNINTVRNWEACHAEPVGGFASKREKACKALEALGIEFLNHGEPGVRLRKVVAVPAAAKAADKPKPARRKKAAPAKASKSRQK